MKKADAAYSRTLFIDEKGALIDKAQMVESQVSATKIKVQVVINTTNWFDSHGDVHIPGLWKKSLSDNKAQGFYLLKMHQKGFEDVITEGCSGVTKTMKWTDLGVNLPGTSEALVFTGIIDQDRNEYMFGQYKKGYVKKHSVGMRYIKMVTCINDEDYPVQKENWDKYIEMVANKQDAIDAGYFWAILEAQVVEGSAVVFASNDVTPAISVEDYEESDDDSTKNEPPVGTRKQPEQKSIIDLIKETQFI
jgi:hypothetical protein